MLDFDLDRCANTRQNQTMEKIICIDSHTGGEPTRVVVSGFPDLAGLPLAAAVERLRSEHDQYRKATVCEPRGNDVVVGSPPVWESIQIIFSILEFWTTSGLWSRLKSSTLMLNSAQCSHGHPQRPPRLV